MNRSKDLDPFDDDRSERQTTDDWQAPALTLDEARATDSFAVLWGEYGASIYLIAAAHEIQCTQDRLEDVLALLDQARWNDFANAGIRYVERREATASVKPHHVRIGANEIWIDRELSHLAAHALALMAGGPAPDG